MRQIKVAPTVPHLKWNIGVALIDLHSQLFQVAAGYETLHDCLSEKELRRGRPVRHAFAKLEKLREAIPPGALLRDVSNYYKNFASGWRTYWIHGFIPVSDFLSAIEKGLNLALTGDRDFTRPVKELNSRFPYRPEAYRTGRYVDGRHGMET